MVIAMLAFSFGQFKWGQSGKARPDPASSFLQYEIFDGLAKRAPNHLSCES
jgi:hypothetical protein